MSNLLSMFKSSSPETTTSLYFEPLEPRVLPTADTQRSATPVEKLRNATENGSVDSKVEEIC